MNFSRNCVEMPYDDEEYDEEYEGNYDASKVKLIDGYEVKGDPFVWYCSFCGKEFLDGAKPTGNPTKPCGTYCSQQIDMLTHLGGSL